jgi:hypothetical protein
LDISLHLESDESFDYQKAESSSATLRQINDGSLARLVIFNILNG